VREKINRGINREVSIQFKFQLQIMKFNYTLHNYSFANYVLLHDSAVERT